METHMRRYFCDVNGSKDYYLKSVSFYRKFRHVNVHKTIEWVRDKNRATVKGATNFERENVFVFFANVSIFFYNIFVSFGELNNNRICLPYGFWMVFFFVEMCRVAFYKIHLH